MDGVCVHGSLLSGEKLEAHLVVQAQVWCTALRHNSSHLALVKEAVGVGVEVGVGMGKGMAMEVGVVVEEEGVVEGVVGDWAANQEDKTPGGQNKVGHTWVTKGHDIQYQ